LDAGREALRRFLAGEDDLESMLGTITLIATHTIPGVDSASITTVTSAGVPKTPASSDALSFDLDQVQYALGDGPCLGAIRHQGVEHMRTEPGGEKWPAFAEAARQQGVTAVLSAPLIDRDVAKGALNLYSRTGYEPEVWDVASLFADQLGIAAVNATLYVQGIALAEQLQKAMESRAVIEQAKGMLMRAERCDANAAFDLLVRASQSRNQKLRDVAASIVERCTTPSGAGVQPSGDGGGSPPPG
jgi:GAF domain-containing protein